MNVLIKKETVITDETDWFRVAPPKGKEKQWKDGASAKEFARFATIYNKQFSKLISNIIIDIFGNKELEDFEGEPEAETNLPPDGSKGPRNHDLLLFNKELVIGIEAKVNETFGSNSIKKEKKDDNSPEKNERINWLIKTLLKGHSIEENEIGELRYQLLTAAAGTILEAYNRGIDKCILLILSFHNDVLKLNNKNDKDFKSFIEKICDDGSNHKEFIIDQSTEIGIKKIDCWFIKKDITIIKEQFKID